MVTNLPWSSAEPLKDEDIRAVRRRAIFEYHKWDQQVGDVATFAGFPLVLRSEEWRRIAEQAESLAREIAAAETELLGRPDLQKRLGLPQKALRALRDAAGGGAPPGVARLMRFDFHFTTDGWRISEVNCDVPGGLNESSGYPRLMAGYYPECDVIDDTTSRYADALVAAMGGPGCVAMVHATAYTDDRQVMVYVAEQLEARGCRTWLVAPDSLLWRDRVAYIADGRKVQRLDQLVRFFPAEWLPNLPRASGWELFFAGSRTPISNPATALLIQSKRLPLVWDELKTKMDTWRALLPETRAPRAVPWRKDDSWLVKPALGRVGEGVGMRGQVEAADWKSIEISARWSPDQWVAQRRFDVQPVRNSAGLWYPCVGIFTIDGHAAGAYGRVARKPLIDMHARDAAVMLRKDT